MGTDYLIPTLEKLGVQEEDWKYVNLGIGGNDVVSCPPDSLPGYAKNKC